MAADAAPTGKGVKLGWTGRTVEEHKLAAARHEDFNLFAIPPLVVLTLLSLWARSPQVNKFLSFSTEGYIVVDTFYNLIVPHCQPSAFRLWTIVIHHLMTGWLTLHPCLYEENNDMTAWWTTVEINTLILTVNRKLKSAFLTKVFFATWAIMRLIWYPYLTYISHVRILGWGAAPCGYHHLQIVLSGILLCALNWLWTFEVVTQRSKVAAPKEKDP